MAKKASKTVKIPQKLQGVLWSVDVNQLELMKDKVYIIHQILMYGSFADIRWLFKEYSKEEIIHVFINIPYKNYPKTIYYFVKNYILGLKDIHLDENRYVTSISGPIRQRTAGNI